MHYAHAEGHLWNYIDDCFFAKPRLRTLFTPTLPPFCLPPLAWGKPQTGGWNCHGYGLTSDPALYQPSDFLLYINIIYYIHVKWSPGSRCLWVKGVSVSRGFCCRVGRPGRGLSRGVGVMRSCLELGDWHRDLCESGCGICEGIVDIRVHCVSL